MSQPAALPVRQPMDLPIVHSIPGRVRLRFDREDGGYAHALACRLRAHPAVRSASRQANGRSLVVKYDAAHEFTDLIRTLPRRGRWPEGPEPEAPGVDWCKIVFACLLNVLPLGLLGGIALTLVTSIVEQSAGCRAEGGKRVGVDTAEAQSRRKSPLSR